VRLSLRLRSAAVVADISAGVEAISEAAEDILEAGVLADRVDTSPHRQRDPAGRLQERRRGQALRQ
jgi:hypothetical protein